MRALDCSCGQHLEADNDEELFERAREHVDTDHPEMELSDEKVRHIVDRGAYEKQEGSANPHVLLECRRKRIGGRHNPLMRAAAFGQTSPRVHR